MGKWESLMRTAIGNSSTDSAAAQLAAYFDSGTFGHASAIADLSRCRPVRAGGDGHGVRHDVVCARCLTLWPCPRWLRRK